MNAEQFAQIERLFQAAADLPRSRRAEFLDRECGKSEQIRSRVEALLEQFNRGETLESPRLAPDDGLCDAFLKACKSEGEGAWRMPMGDAYDAKLKSRIADMMNVGGRDGGAITAAQFLKRFVKEDMPWCHLDIAGTALVKADTTLAPKGATGWGVMALDRLIRDKFEG